MSYIWSAREEAAISAGCGPALPFLRRPRCLILLSVVKDGPPFFAFPENKRWFWSWPRFD
jgi:hypothetical protein